MSRASYRQSNERFTYHNENPKSLKSAGDCVIRAIAFATGKSWDEVFTALCSKGAKLKRMPNDQKVYEEYLKELGIKKMSQPRKLDNTKYTVAEFTKYAWRKGTYIISVANHLTVVKDGKIYDTWDCGDKCVGNYWTIH